MKKKRAIVFDNDLESFSRVLITEKKLPPCLACEVDRSLFKKCKAKEEDGFGFES